MTLPEGRNLKNDNVSITPSRRRRGGRIRNTLGRLKSARARRIERRIALGGGQKRKLGIRPNFLTLAKRGVTLGRLGSLEARLASNKGQIKRAQALRYFVFYEEMAAKADAKSAQKKRDMDRYDNVCDHVLVVDHATKEKRVGRSRPKLVGTYRLLRQEIAESKKGFYSQGEFDINPMLTTHPESYFLELGRSCVLADYRGKHTIELLWSAIWRYVLNHKVDVMFGCASFPTTNPEDIAQELAFLHHYIDRPKEWDVKAHEHLYVDMNMMAKEDIDPKRALAKLPPLIKGYIRIGAFVGNGAIVDHQFGTTDVFMILPIKNISEKYIKYFGAGGERHAG